MNNLGGTDYNKRIPPVKTNANQDVGAYSPDYKKAYEAAVGQVKNQYQTTRNQLTEQSAALPNQYQQQKNQVYNQAEQSKRSLDELNAQRGLYRSGQGISDIARTYATRDAGINDLGNQQTQAAQQLSNRLNELNNQESTAIAGLQGQEGQDLRNYALQQAQLTGSLNGQQTMAGQSNALQQALAEAGITGKYNGQQTLAAQGQAADISNQAWNRQLALLQALQNYQLGTAQVTDTFPQISGFNYGDVMKQALARLGVA